jgi:hypothetical protein
MKLDTKNIPEKLGVAVQKLARYRLIIFILMIASVYGYVVITINGLSTQQPSTQNVNGELGSIKTPKLDETVVKQLEALRDNSVRVKTLFDEARNNPFNE